MLFCIIKSNVWHFTIVPQGTGGRKPGSASWIRKFEITARSLRWIADLYTRWGFSFDISPLFNWTKYLRIIVLAFQTLTNSVYTPGSAGSPVRSEAEMLAEARLLRQHKGRLEARMTILEQHNHQLEAQLQRLRQLLTQVNYCQRPVKALGWVNKRIVLIKCI